MEEGVKYYLAEGMPFSVQLKLKLETLGSDAISVEGSSDPIVRFLGGHRIRCVEGNTSGELEEELTNKFTIAMQSTPLKWRMGVSCSRSKLLEDDQGHTKFRLIFDRGSDVKDFLGETASLQAEISEWRYVGTAKTFARQFTTAAMPVTPVQNEGKLVFVDAAHNSVLDAMLPDSLFPYRRSITGKMNLLVIDKSYGDLQPDKMAVNKRMLEEELATDLVIIPSNGVEVKCHRSFLAAHSDVFRTMFGTDMQEAKTHRIEMPDMSEEGVRALLAYLYHWDTSRAEESCGVALELLMAGHKYNIECLEKVMRKVVLAKPDAWYDVDVAKELFRFVRNLDVGWNLLKKKAVMVLKMRAPCSENLLAVQKLFQGDPQGAMDFYNWK